MGIRHATPHVVVDVRYAWCGQESNHKSLSRGLEEKKALLEIITWVKVTETVNFEMKRGTVFISRSANSSSMQELGDKGIGNLQYRNREAVLFRSA